MEQTFNSQYSNLNNPWTFKRLEDISAEFSLNNKLDSLPLERRRTNLRKTFLFIRRKFGRRRIVQSYH